MRRDKDRTHASNPCEQDPMPMQPEHERQPNAQNLTDHRQTIPGTSLWSVYVARLLGWFGMYADVEPKKSCWKLTSSFGGMAVR